MTFRLRPLWTSFSSDLQSLTCKYRAIWSGETNQSTRGATCSEGQTRPCHPNQRAAPCPQNHGIEMTVLIVASGAYPQNRPHPRHPLLVPPVRRSKWPLVTERHSQCLPGDKSSRALPLAWPVRAQPLCSSKEVYGLFCVSRYIRGLRILSGAGFRERAACGAFRCKRGWMPWPP